MRRAILLAIIFLFGIATTKINVVHSQSENIAYVDSNGIVEVGAWFYYNITLQDGAIRHVNCSIFFMNSTHIGYTQYWEEINRTDTFYRNVSFGITFFWINLTLALKFIEYLNRTTDSLYRIIYYNNSFLHVTFNFTNEDRHHNLVWWDSNHIIRRLYWYAEWYSKGTKTVINETEDHRLLSLYSPTLNQTGGEGENETNQTTNETSGSSSSSSSSSSSGGQGSSLPQTTVSSPSDLLVLVPTLTIAIILLVVIIVLAKRIEVNKK